MPHDVWHVGHFSKGKNPVLVSRVREKFLVTLNLLLFLYLGLFSLFCHLSDPVDETYVVAGVRKLDPLTWQIWPLYRKGEMCPTIPSTNGLPKSLQLGACHEPRAVAGFWDQKSPESL
jgi:hypothetical protein